MVDIQKYIKEAEKTLQIGPKYIKEYITLGLIGEVGELANKSKKVFRGDYIWADITDDLIDELGDVCWYLAVCCKKFDIYIDSVSNYNSYGGNFYEVIKELNYTVSLFVHYCNDDKNDAITNIESCFSQVVCLSSLLGVDLQLVLDNNIKKLADRQKRGVIKGSGDNR